jgi:hypothetical protein
MPKNMKTDGNDAYRQRTYPLSSGKRVPSGSVDGIQVVVLEDAPNVVDYEEDPGAVLTMQVVDRQVVEKCISMKNRWHPETIANEVKTQGEISSKHLVLTTFTVEVIYFGNVEISETLTYRIDDGGYLPQNPTYEANHPMPTDLSGWDNDALVDGSSPSSPMRPEFKTMMEEEVMRILYGEGYEFNNEGICVRSCKHCRDSVCVMTANEYMIEIFDDGRQAEEVRRNNILRKEAYRQMALTIKTAGQPAPATESSSPSVCRPASGACFLMPTDNTWVTAKNKLIYCCR